MERFDFAFDPPARRLLRPLGVDGRRAFVTLTDDGRLTARYGRWSVDTPLGNVSDARVTGPYPSWVRAVGPHLSFADRGVTFGTNAALGACVTFHRPVKGLDPLGLLRHPGLTVTVADPVALVAAVRRRAGLA